MNGHAYSLSPFVACGLAVVCAAVCGTSVHSAQAGTFTTFDPPGSIDTEPSGINAAGAIAGTYATGSFEGGSFVTHGFLREPDGTFTRFDIPGGINNAEINPAGAIAGYYTAGSFPNAYTNRGFLRAPDGTLTIFDVPGAATQGTFVTGINPAGTITGTYYDASSMFHGFLRAPDGAFTMFDAPDSTSTQVSAVNPAGATTGSAVTGSAVRAFLRAPDGTFTTFDSPGSTGAGPTGINPAGAITGSYQDAGGVTHGFLWIPAVCVGDCGGTRAVAINDLITLVNIALGTAQPAACPHGVPSGTEVNVALIIQAVNNALNGCGAG